MLKKRLLLLSLLIYWGCIENPIGREYRYEFGRIAPCDVERDSTSEPSRNQDWIPEKLWKNGPYHTWNTSPSDQCEGNIVYHNSDNRKNVRLYVTYPSRSSPTHTGDGSPADGTFPLIIFGHANHDRQCAIYQSYYSLHDHWASWGFIVASYDGTELNCKPGSYENIQGRADLFVRSYEAMRAANNDPESFLFHKIDFDRIVLVGHSRGGAAQYLALPSIENVVGVISLQGLESMSYLRERPRIPTLGITAGRDVDLNYPAVEFMEDFLQGPYTWININGGIHAFTADNSPLEFDDTPQISRTEQHNITEFYTTAFLGKWIGLPSSQNEREQRKEFSQILETHVGSQIAIDKISSQGVFQRWRPTKPIFLIDDFNRDTTEPKEGAHFEFQDINADFISTYLETRKFSRALLLETRKNEGIFRIHFDTKIQLKKNDRLEFRIKQRDFGRPSTHMSVSLNDGTFVDAFQFIGPLPIKNRFTEGSIPISRFNEKTLSSLTIRISAGAILIDDLRLVQ